MRAGERLRKRGPQRAHDPRPREEIRQRCGDAGRCPRGMRGLREGDHLREGQGSKATPSKTINTGRRTMSQKKKLTTNAGAPVVDNQNTMTAGPRGPALLQDVWFLEKLAHFDREVIPERRMHAKGSGAFGPFTVTRDITKYTRAKVFSKVGKKTDLFARFSTVAGERGAADAERDIRGFAVKLYTDEGNWDLGGKNTPGFFLR